MSVKEIPGNVRKRLERERERERNGSITVEALEKVNSSKYI